MREGFFYGRGLAVAGSGRGRDSGGCRLACRVGALLRGAMAGQWRQNSTGAGGAVGACASAGGTGNGRSGAGVCLRERGLVRRAKGRQVLYDGSGREAVQGRAISFTYGRIKTFDHAARRRLLLAGGRVPDDAGLFGWLIWWAVVNAWYSAIAAGIRRTHAGLIGGQFLMVSANVPAAFAAATLSGMRQREK